MSTDNKSQSKGCHFFRKKIVPILSGLGIPHVPFQPKFFSSCSLWCVEHMVQSGPVHCKPPAQPCRQTYLRNKYGAFLKKMCCRIALVLGCLHLEKKWRNNAKKQMELENANVKEAHFRLKSSWFDPKIRPKKVPPALFCVRRLFALPPCQHPGGRPGAGGAQRSWAWHQRSGEVMPAASIARCVFLWRFQDIHGWIFV